MKKQASEFLDKLCREFSELSAPERASIRKQLNQDLVKFLQAARHIESVEVKGKGQNNSEMTSSISAEAGIFFPSRVSHIQITEY